MSNWKITKIKVFALDFCNFPVWNIEFGKLDFFLFWTGFLHAKEALKIQFTLGEKISLSNSKFETKEYQNSNADQARIFLFIREKSNGNSSDSFGKSTTP